MRAKGAMRALFLGLLLTTLAMLLLIPTQVEGWGYRYLHGLMGSICLLAVWGWTRLTDALAKPARERAEAAFVAACAASLALLLPLRGWQAHQDSRPYALAAALIEKAPADVVIVDDDGLWFDSGSVVRNDPYLSNRPKVMVLEGLDEVNLRALCARDKLAALVCLAALAPGVASEAAADNAYPTRAIHIIVPFPAGGPSDLVSRVIAQKMSEDWQVPVIVDNRPGGNTIIGAQAVARAAPDGYTLLMAIDSTLVMNQFLYKRLPYDPFNDFAPITLTTETENAYPRAPASPAALPSARSFNSFGSASAVMGAAWLVPVTFLEAGNRKVREVRPRRSQRQPGEARCPTFRNLHSLRLLCALCESFALFAVKGFFTSGWHDRGNRI